MQVQSISMVYRIRGLKVVLLSLLVLVSACAPQRQPVPPGVIPQRSPLTPAEEQQGHELISSISEQYELVYNHPRYDELQEVVDQLTAGAKADHDPWHIYVLNSPDVKNAAATRGNHIIVWSGFLSDSMSRDDIATVLAHEIAHVLANHTEPDPSEQFRRLMVGMGAMAVGVAVTAATKDPYLASNLGNLSASITQEIGSGMLVYPYSRDMELEADRIGLLILAASKIDPRKAIDFWDRAQHDPAFSAPVEFLSSHPVAEDRLARLEEVLPEAIEFYNRAMAGQDPVPQGASPPPPPTGEPKLMGDAPPPISKLEARPAAKGQWVVRGDKAVLRLAPSHRAKPIGEFQNGAVVNVIDRYEGWVEIDSPDKGFMESRHIVKR